VAECIELARMRDHGKTAEQLATLFGYKEVSIRHYAAVGFIPGLSKLSGGNGYHQEGMISLKEAINYLLPMCAWPVDIPKNDKALDYSLYDYTEVTACIDKLVSGKLKPEDLPTYAAERREASQEPRSDAFAARTGPRVPDELDIKLMPTHPRVVDIATWG
jgi:hypothetical protein